MGRISLYEIDPICVEQFEELLLVNSEVGIKDFCLAIVLGYKTNKKKHLTRNEIVDSIKNYNSLYAKTHGFQSSSLAARAKELTELGCWRETKTIKDIDGKRTSCLIYKLLSLGPVINHLRSEPLHSPVKRGRRSNATLEVFYDAVERSSLFPLMGNKDVIPYTEHAFSILDAASRSHKQKDKVITCVYQIKKDDYITITASTSTEIGSEICLGTDQRIILALNGMLKEGFERGLTTRFHNDYCIVDLYELVVEIGLVGRSQSNRDDVRRMLYRLATTTFRVDATYSEYWRAKFMPSDNFTSGIYRYIDEIYEAKDWEGFSTINGKQGVGEGRYYVIKFSDLVNNAIRSETNTFRAHDSLKTEKLHLVFRINNWVKAVVGVRDKQVGDDYHQYPLDILQQRVHPSSRVDNFVKLFYEVAERQNQRELELIGDAKHGKCEELVNLETGKPVGTFWLNGYYFKIWYDQKRKEELYRILRCIRKKRFVDYPIITIWRDRLDEIVGDESDHNLALRRQTKALSKTTPEHEGSPVENSGESN